MQFRYLIDRVVRYVLLSSALLSIVVVLLIGIFTLIEALPAFAELGKPEPRSVTVRKAVAADPAAIGCLSFSYLPTEEEETKGVHLVKALRVDGVEPIVENLSNGRYPFSRPLNLVFREEMSRPAQAWVDWIYRQSHKYVRARGYLEVGPAPPAQVSGSIDLAGSLALYPLVDKLARAFAEENPGLRIHVQGGGSAAGIQAAGEGLVDIGMASREIKPEEYQVYPDLHVTTIAREGIAIVVHPGVGVDDLSLGQVRKIFAGRVTHWQEVGGTDRPIVVIVPEEGSGTRTTFEELLMGRTPLAAAFLVETGDAGVLRAVAATPGAIGYLPFGFVDGSVKALKIDGVEPTAKNVADGQYPLHRAVNMLTLGEPDGAVKAWLDWMLSEPGQKIVVEEGYIAGLSGEVTVVGSEAMLPLLERLGGAFRLATKTVQVQVRGGGSAAGIEAVGRGRADMGMATRDLNEAERLAYPDLQVYSLGRDGIAIVVNPAMPVEDLTEEQVQEILAGRVDNWSSVGGPDLPMVVHACTDPDRSPGGLFFEMGRYFRGMGKLLGGTVWRPGEDQYGILAMVLGSVLATIGAMVFGVPLSLAGAVFLAEVAPATVRSVVRPAVELLAGIPSVVYGLFGLVVLVPIVRKTFLVPHNSGFGLLSASVVLAVMILPTVTNIAEDALRALPQEYKEGSLALGATHWQTIWSVLLPAARSGIIAAVILGTGRALGETMAMIMVIGNSVVIPKPLNDNPLSIFLSQARTLTGNIAVEISYATGLQEDALFATGVVLFILIMLVNSLARLLMRRRQ